MPINYFVFTKNDEYFESKLLFTLILSEDENKTQFYRESWRMKITKNDYKETRNSDNVYKFEKNIQCLPGKYKIYLNIQDEDSRSNWKSIKEIDVQRVKYIGDPLIFIRDKRNELIQANNIIDKNDTLWIRVQLNVLDSIKYLLKKDDSIIDSNKVYIDDKAYQNLYHLPIPISLNDLGEYEIVLKLFDDIKKINFLYGMELEKYWTSDIDEIMNVMKYVLPYSEYRKISDQNDSKKWELINLYWKDKDPTPITIENELLIEFNQRVKYSNKNFSIFSKGWRSDRGKIYIIYGEPNLVDESYQDSIGHQYQKWVYPNGKEFIFIDRGMSGDYTLYQERH